MPEVADGKEVGFPARNSSSSPQSPPISHPILGCEREKVRVVTRLWEHRAGCKVANCRLIPSFPQRQSVCTHGVAHLLVRHASVQKKREEESFFLGSEKKRKNRERSSAMQCWCACIRKISCSVKKIWVVDIHAALFAFHNQAYVPPAERLPLGDIFVHRWT